MIIKEGFNDTMINISDKVKNTYDYLKGNRSNNLGTLYDASSAEIKSNSTLYKLVQEFNKSKTPHKVQFDKMGKKLLLTFDATKVPTDLVDHFKPEGKYGKKVNSYDPSSHTVEMIFDASPSKLPKTDRALYKDAKEGGVDKVVGTGESLKEGVEMTIPEPYYDEEHNEFYLRVTINGVTYNFKMKEDSPYSIDKILPKIIGIMNHSSGKALAFMKKNMTGERSDKMKVEELNDESTYEEIDSKEVVDSDGFLTEYTLYTNGENFVCIFGDRELYTPEDTEPDFETENEEEAREWFDNYTGFDDDDEEYDESLKKSENDDDDEEEDNKIFFSNPGGTPEYARYKYDRRHGDKDVFKSKDYAIKNDDKSELVDPSDLLELKTVNYQNLKDQLTNELFKVMTSPEFGYDEDEAKKYSGVEIKDNEVSVWAEVGFEALWDIKEALDPIIAKYDKDAYFDMEDVGRLVAVVNDSKLKESSNPFKSHHICKGCGKPLDQCTCEVKEEDVDLDSLDESVNEESDFDLICKAISGDEKSIKSLQDKGYKINKLVNPLQYNEVGTFEVTDLYGKKYNYDNTLSHDARSREESATQSSSIGQHKVDSIDLLEPKEKVKS